VVFVNGAMPGLIPGDGGMEVFEDTLPLLEDILDLLPVFIGGAGSC
jgi:hypothetical protein